MVVPARIEATLVAELAHELAEAFGMVRLRDGRWRSGHHELWVHRGFNEVEVRRRDAARSFALRLRVLPDGDLSARLTGWPTALALADLVRADAALDGWLFDAHLERRPGAWGGPRSLGQRLGRIPN